MPNDLIIPVTDINEIYGTAANKFDTLRLYSAPSQASGYSLLTSIALVAGDTTYAYTDLSGTDSTFYKVTLYNSVTTNEQAINSVDPFPATRDTLTRKELRQLIISNLSGEIYIPTSYTTSSATAPLLKDDTIQDEYYTGWHIYRPDSSNDNDNDRRISGFSSDAADGTVSHSGFDYADTNVADEQFEIVPVDITFRMMNQRINDGLLRTRWLYRYEFGTTSGIQQYALPHFVESESYVKQIWRRYGGTADTYLWRPIEHRNGWGKVRGSNFQCVLDIYPSLTENEVLALEVWRPGEKLATETDFTRVQQTWAEAAAMVYVLRYLRDQDTVRHQQSAYNSLIKDWTEILRQESRKHGPTPAMKLQTPQPMSGMPRV